MPSSESTVVTCTLPVWTLISGAWSFCWATAAALAAAKTSINGNPNLNVVGVMSRLLSVSGERECRQLVSSVTCKELALISNDPSKVSEVAGVHHRVAVSGSAGAARRHRGRQQRARGGRRRLVHAGS